MKNLLGLFSFLLVSTFAPQPDIKDIQFLAGTWKIEKKESYESWTLNNGRLEGNAYKMKAGSKQINEYLLIQLKGEKMTYTAKVPSQNNAQPIDFVLNTAVKDKFSFENLGHDFPKKIQYTKLNDTALFVAVLGEGDKGFSYKMFKQK